MRAAGGRVIMLKVGEFALVGMNVSDAECQVPGVPEMFLQWIFPSEHSLWGLSEVASLRSFGESAKLGLRVSGATAASMRRRFEQFLAAAGIARLAIFFQILAELANAPVDEVESSVNGQLVRPENGMHESTICRAVTHICARHGDGVRMSEMLRLTNMSRASFARQFRRCTGTSFSSFRNRVRLDAVCRELRETVEPVGTIAFGHGFNQLSFFNRLFRRELGMSPTEYRDQYRTAKAS